MLLKILTIFVVKVHVKIIGCFDLIVVKNNRKGKVREVLKWIDFGIGLVDELLIIVLM